MDGLSPFVTKEKNMSRKLDVVTLDGEEYDKLIADAERYRWLRNQDNQTREGSPCVSDDSFNTYFSADLDALIDSEMGANVK